VLLQIFFVHFCKSDLQKSYGLRYFCITRGLKATHLSVCKDGDDVAAGAFLKSSHIGTTEFWTPADTLLAHRLWHQFQQRRRQLQVVKRPVADVLIAAFAERFQGIITRNASDFRNILPTLRIVEP
jgi:hypothetical protein